MKKIFLILVALYSLSASGQTSSSTKALIDSNLPTNGVKAITATNLRTTLKAIVDFTDTKAPIVNPVFPQNVTINGDLNFGTNGAISLITELDRKVEKIAGKGLSSNDFTDVYKAKADSISLKADSNNPALTGTVTISKDEQVIGSTTPTGGFLLQNPNITYTALEMGVGASFFGTWIQARSLLSNTSQYLALNPTGGNVGVGITNGAKTLSVNGSIGFGGLAVKDLQTELDKKQDKVIGKDLSTNDFTNEYKTALDNIDNSVNLIGQADNGNNNSKITISNQGFGADSRLTFTQSNYLTGAGWQFGEDILNVHGSYFGFAGNSNPQANIDLGTSGTLKIGNLSGAGKVLTSDASGNATWSTSPLDAKQNTLTGTGFVKSTGGTISYDNSTYLTSSALSPYLTTAMASSTYATQTNLALKANIASPTFTTGAVITGTASNTVQGGPFLYLNGGSGSSFSTIQQGVGTLDFYGFNGSSWANNLSVNNATGNVGIGTSSPNQKTSILSAPNNINLGIIGSYPSDGNSYYQSVAFGRPTMDYAVSEIRNYANLGISYNSKLSFWTTNTSNVKSEALLIASDISIFSSGLSVLGKLDVVSTTSPSYPFPRMTTTQVNAITGMTAGAWVFDTTTNHPKYYNGSAWVQL